MKEFFNVQGSKEQAQELIICKDTVYVHSNIRLIEFAEDDPRYGEELYTYDEIQYTLDEYYTKSTNGFNIPDVVYNEIIDSYTLSLIEEGVL